MIPNLTPVALGLMLAGAGTALTQTEVVVPPVSAGLQIWGDVVRDVDALGLALTRVSAEREKEIGEALAADFEPNLLPTSGDAGAYVAAVGEAVLAAAGEQPFAYSFAVLDSPYKGAFALPGGHVYITKGLLSELGSEAELAAVIGHEIAHVTLRHAIGNVQYAMVVAGIAGDDLGAVAGIAHRVVSAHYRRDEETDADLEGLRLAAEAGYDPTAAVGVLSFLADMERPGPAPRRTVTGELAAGIGTVFRDLRSSHPIAAKRVADAEAMLRRYAGHWDGRRFYVGARNLADLEPWAAMAHDDEWTTFQR